MFCFVLLSYNEKLLLMKAKERVTLYMDENAVRQDKVFMDLFGEDGFKTVTKAELEAYLRPVNTDHSVNNLDWEWFNSSSSI